MPNRIIKESICTSETINELSPLEEITFYRLLVNCDDYGCFDARERVVISRLFPLRDIKGSEVKKTLQKLAGLGLIQLYEVGGKPFLHVCTWAEHQRVRVSRHKYPMPEDADTCGHSPQLAANGGEMRLESQSESQSESEMLTARFETFWKAYPRHESKQAARKAFDKLKVSDGLLQTMLTAIERQKKTAQWAENNGQFIPHPSTWLNGKRWEDDVKPASVKTTSAANFDQRDYSGYEAELMNDLAAKMQAFKNGGVV